jgi:hypothetical protein
MKHHVPQTVDAAVKAAVKLIENTGSNHSTSRRWSTAIDAMFFALAKTTASSAKAAEAAEEGYMSAIRAFVPEGHTAGAEGKNSTERANLSFIREGIPALFALCSTGVMETDFLGRVAGELGSLESGLGQFFTPFELSRLMSRIALSEEAAKATIRKKGFVSLSEPACGAGGMVLAMAAYFREVGLDPSRHMDVTCIDVSYTAARMCFVQLSLADISATVFIGDTLSQEPLTISYQTPARRKAFLPYIKAWAPPTRRRVVAR